MSYINEIINNYNNLNNKDQLTLLERLTKLNKNQNIFYEQDLKTIEDFLIKQLELKLFLENYKKLDAKQKKEFQTLLYVKASQNKNENYFSNHLRLISNIYNPELQEENNNNDNFEVDWPTFCIEQKNLDRKQSIALIQNFIDNYYSFLFRKEDIKSRQTEKKFNLLINQCITEIRNNLNNSTRELFDYLTTEQKLTTLFEMTYLNAELLNESITEREALNTNKHQSPRQVIGNGKGYIKRKYPKIKQNHSNPNKVCYR